MPSIRFKNRSSSLSWYPRSHLPLGSDLAILDDPDNCGGRSFCSGIFIQKPFKIRDGNSTVIISSEVVDSSILFRRQALPVESNMSGAAVVAKGDGHKWDQVVGFQSFQFVPPAATYQPEQLWDEGFLDGLKRSTPVDCCICGARPVPEGLKNSMDIVNDISVL